MWWALLATAWAAPRCEVVGFHDITSVPAPAVIVLGERHGHRFDLGRATRVVRKLARSGEPVRVGLEAVHESQQSVLDAFAEGRIDAPDLPELMAWDDTWGFRWGPYEPLVTAAIDGVTVRAAGLDLGPRPAERMIPIPPRYMDLLRGALGGHELPIGMESRFVQSMAWRDHRITELSLQGWDGTGYVVIVTGRGHVEGGKGATWQAARLTTAPVHGFALAWADAPCHAGDKVWR